MLHTIHKEVTLFLQLIKPRDLRFHLSFICELFAVRSHASNIQIRMSFFQIWTRGMKNNVTVIRAPELTDYDQIRETFLCSAITMTPRRSR